ncbi:hypothetical protein [Streptomyces paludis]|uniref:Uncharacterized protein n=1 Tax=Streptomyces paludis TaxID=2282738 RepID=A0A345HZE7_9ACTN|nr:hypothetical protein [Streptomyces paludis]AXG82071.1 hypothetical protein DVK44_34925 [Streptomyces paludis]
MDTGHPPRRTAPVVAVVVLVMAALTAGWQLIDRALNDRQPLPRGAVLELGPDPALLRVADDGWSLSKSRSDAGSSYVLTRAGVEVAAVYVGLTEAAGPGELWAGLRRVQSVADGGSRLGAPRAIVARSGARGRTGTLTRDGRTGTATLWLPPGGGYAVEITVLARPDAGAGAVRAATALAHSVSFPRQGP